MEFVDSKEVRNRLKEGEIQPSASRLAIASYVWNTETHPTAEEVKREVEKSFPTVSLATVYNTLNLLVEKGLLKSIESAGKQGSRLIRYDRNTKPHFHFLDESTGEMIDLDPKVLKVIPNFSLFGDEFQISEINVTVKGRRSPKARH